jgi:hypothetical protein
VYPAGHSGSKQDREPDWRIVERRSEPLSGDVWLDIRCFDALHTLCWYFHRI